MNRSWWDVVEERNAKEVLAFRPLEGGRIGPLSYSTDVPGKVQRNHDGWHAVGVAGLDPKEANNKWMGYQWWGEERKHSRGYTRSLFDPIVREVDDPIFSNGAALIQFDAQARRLLVCYSSA
jgi:hypothetical protein